ncbi:cytochrome c [Colwelliaceae bacterium BS250]
MKKIIGLIIIVLTALIFIEYGSGKHAQIPVAKESTRNLEQNIARGKAVAIEADCLACHTVEHGGDYAGGLHFATPFGDLYSTNITQDKQSGIGNYNREDFYHAVKYGYSKNIGNLYPAMPYTSYRKLSDDDMDALWAYMQTIKAIPTPNVPNQLMFPTNIRFTLGTWNQFFFDDTNFQPVANKSEQWNEGKYLVEAAGHCGECHSPRNLGFAIKSEKILQGAIVEGWNAVPITAEGLTKNGWTLHSLTQFFETGNSPQGTTFGGMLLVIRESLSHLTHEQRLAMSIYLLDLEPTELNITSKSKRVHLSKKQKSQPGYSTYATYCAGCHGVSGLGKPNAVIQLSENTIFTEDSPFNAIAVVLRGLPKQQDNLLEGSVAMTSFTETIEDQELANLVNFAKTTWGNKTNSNITAADVKQVRQQLAKEGYLNHMGDKVGH